jgi:hypothetical protein
VRAFKFLDGQGRSPFTRTPWRPGEWVEAAATIPCREGVHGCRAEDLSCWLAPELWEVELEDPVVETRHKLTARRGRLVEAVAGYLEAAVELGAVCAWRARDRAVRALRAAGQGDLAGQFAAAATLDQLAALGAQVDDSTFARAAAALAADTARFAITGPITEAPFIGACSAGHTAAGMDGEQIVFDTAYADERVFESLWLVERLGLTAQ